MGGNPRENENDGFWDGGSFAHHKSGESSGRASGYPGPRKVSKVGVFTDLEKPLKPKLAIKEQDQPKDDG